MNKEEKIIIDLINRNKKLKEENDKLKKEKEKQKDEKAFWHIKNDLKKEKIEELEIKYTQTLEVAQDRFERIQKAIEYAEHYIKDKKTNEILDYDIMINSCVLKETIGILKGEIKYNE